MCPSGNGNDDDEENSPFDGYMKGNIACVADGCTTVTFGALIGPFRLPSSESELKAISGDFCRLDFSSVIESSEFECSISLSLLCGETLLMSDLSNSSLEDDVKLRFASAR